MFVRNVINTSERCDCLEMWTGMLAGHGPLRPGHSIRTALLNLINVGMEWRRSFHLASSWRTRPQHALDLVSRSGSGGGSGSGSPLTASRHIWGQVLRGVVASCNGKCSMEHLEPDDNRRTFIYSNTAAVQYSSGRAAPKPIAGWKALTNYLKHVAPRRHPIILPALGSHPIPSYSLPSHPIESSSWRDPSVGQAGVNRHCYANNLQL